MPKGNGTKSSVQEGRCGLASKAEWREKRRQLTVLQVVGSENDFIQPPGGAVGSRLRLYLPARWGKEGMKQRSLSPPFTLGLFSPADDESPGLYGFLHVIVHSAKGFKQSASKCL